MPFCQHLTFSVLRCGPQFYLQITPCTHSLDVAATSHCSLILIYRPQKDEKLSLPSGLTYSGRFTNISGHPSAVVRAQDSERLPVKDRRSTTVLYSRTFEKCLLIDMAVEMICHTKLCISTVQAVVSLSICCLSRSCILLKRVNIFSNFFHLWVATPFLVFRTKPYANILMGTPTNRASNAGGV